MTNVLKVETFGDPSGYFANVPAELFYSLDIRNTLTNSFISDDGKSIYLGMDSAEGVIDDIYHVRLGRSDVSDYDVFNLAVGDAGYSLDIKHIEVGSDLDNSLLEFQRDVVISRLNDTSEKLVLEDVKSEATSTFFKHFSKDHHPVRDLNPLLVESEPVHVIVDGETYEASVSKISISKTGAEVVTLDVDGYGPYDLRAIDVNGNVTVDAFTPESPEVSNSPGM